MEQDKAVTKLDFSSSPTVAKFMRSKGFVRGAMGPVGSGKSYLVVQNFGAGESNRNPRLEMVSNILDLR